MGQVWTPLHYRFVAYCELAKFAMRSEGSLDENASTDNDVEVKDDVVAKGVSRVYGCRMFVLAR